MSAELAIDRIGSGDAVMEPMMFSSGSSTRSRTR